MNANTNRVSERIYAAARRGDIYELPAIPVNGRPSAAACRLADSLFEQIRQTSSYRPHSDRRQRKQWRQLVYAAGRAVHAGGCVRYSRANKRCPKSLKRLIQCAVDVGFFDHVLSKRTNCAGAKQSRLLPTAKFRQHVPNDPWEIVPPRRKDEYVCMRRRGDQRKRPLPFDRTHPEAADSQWKLEVINTTNADCEITYQPARQLYRVQLRPIHWRLFHEGFEHGRIYLETARGREVLRREERATIQFNGKPSIELDYSATHPRLAYHLRGLDCEGDPYALLGDGTTSSQRYLVKLVVNAALNAASRKAAIGACFEAIRLKTREGDWKEGKRRDRAMKLRGALREIGIPPGTDRFFKQARAYFGELYDLAIQRHEPIAANFGNDAGARLMKVESDIALEVMDHLAINGVSVLGVHDSFIVPRIHGDLLSDIMVECYRAKTGFVPVVK